MLQDHIYILSIETSASNCSVCLSKNGDPWIIQELLDPNGHGSNLSLFIRKVMELANFDFNSLNAIAISAGPGSYTGLRIGAASAKALCYAADLPLISVDTLRSLAIGAQMKRSTNLGLTVAMKCARRMSAYVGVYDAQSNILNAPDYVELDGDWIAALSVQWPGELLFCGDAVEKSKHLLPQNAQISTVLHPSAAYLSEIAFEKYNNKDFEDPAYFDPNYIKQPHITKAKPRFSI